MSPSSLVKSGLVAIAFAFIGGCQAFVSSVTDGFTKNLTNSILNSDDLHTIREGLPAYLIGVDALLHGNKTDADLMFAAAQLNGSYALAFADDLKQQKSLTAKARELAFRASCIEVKALCEIEAMSFDQATAKVGNLHVGDVPALYGLASAWASWLQVHADDLHAVAQLAKVKLLIERLLELDETYELGAPHMYMGVFESLLPPSLGGRPEVAKRHFEKAIAISKDRNLYAKVLYAQNYARMTLNRELHDSLLREVLVADPHVDGYTLQNSVAQEIASELLAEADEFF